MKHFLVIALLVCSSSAFAAPTPASDASIKEMLEVTNAKKLVEGMTPQLGAYMKNVMQQATKGRVMTPKEQAALDRVSATMMETFRDELSWDKIEPLYLTVYRNSFTQDEIDGIIAFYKTPAGAAMIRKMPVVIQQTMIEMQKRVGPMMQRVQKAIQDAATDPDAGKP